MTAVDTDSFASLRSYDEHYIDGAWVKSTGSARIEVVLPATESVIAHTPAGTTADVDHTVEAGSDRSRSVTGRADRLPNTRRRWRSLATATASGKARWQRW